MSDGQRFLLSIILGTAVILGGTYWFIFADTEIWVFWAFVFIGMAVMFLPVLFFRPSEIYSENGGLRIKAPFVDLDLPADYIQAVEFRESFKPGLRMYGYGGIKKGYGDFTNKELGGYTFAGDTRIPAFILVRHHTNRILVFNHKDAATTFSIYSQLKSGPKSDAPVVRECDRTVSSHGFSKKHFVIVIGIIIAAVAVIIATLFMSGHVDASMDDDSLRVDAFMVDEDIAYTDISSVELREDMDYGSRVAGFAAGDYLSGRFRNSEFGNYLLAVHSDVTKCIVVHRTAGKTVVFNLGSNAATESFFTELDARVP